MGQLLTKAFSHKDETRHRLVNGTEYRFRHRHHTSEVHLWARKYPKDQNIESCRIEVDKRLADYPGGAERWVRVHSFHTVRRMEEL